MRASRICVSLILIAFLLSFSVQLDAGVPKNLQVKLILKIISLDKSFGRFGSPIKIGVSSDEAMGAFSAVQGTLKVKNVSFTVSKMSAPADASAYRIIYIDNNWSSKSQEVGQLAAAGKILVFCDEDSCLMSAGGGGIAFKLVGGKPKIIMNHNNVKGQGSEFPAKYMRLFQLVGN